MFVGKSNGFESISCRESTFASWPKSMNQSATLMAMAGFIYTGIGDRVVCYSCGGGVKDWEDSDNPWLEHQRFYPHCSHLKSTPAHIQSINETANPGQVTRNCRICHTNRSEVLSLACNHAATCKNCFEGLTECPVCKVPFDQIITLFY